MEKPRPILSICIPTNGAIEWMLPTLRSVYSQNVDHSLFEVIITDNGTNSRLGEVLKEFRYDNLRYIPTNDKGFLNLVTCLQKGTGIYNKMLNHRMLLKAGMLSRMIEIIELYKERKPVLYFLNKNLQLPDFTICDDIDSFLREMNIWVSWSGGIGFWREDINQLSIITPNSMFPNTTLLLEHRTVAQYVIWNEQYGTMQDDSGKGGFDLFNAICVVFLGILSDQLSQKRITIDTFLFVKNKVYKFICQAYFDEVVNRSNHTYVIKDVKKNMLVYYSYSDYYRMVLRENIRFYVNPFLKIFKSFIKKMIWFLR